MNLHGSKLSTLHKNKWVEVARQKFLFPRQAASYRITARKPNENTTER